jgi:polyphosphate kinase
VERVRRYAYLSTGNFHEDTAKVYSDFGLFTADERLTEEMSRVFAFLENPTKKPNRKFKHLLVGQFNLRDGLEEKIDREIKLAKQGKPARIILKMNSLEDNAMVEKLHKASNAGVEIRMIIRGICTMIPNVPQWSENIQIHSIVDRFLEHARVFMFYNEGAEEIYLSSADFMYRNLSARIETTFPVYDEDAKNLIRQVIDFQWNDNIKSRYVNGQQDNLYVRNENPLAIRAQNETYFYLKNMQSL